MPGRRATHIPTPGLQSREGAAGPLGGGWKDWPVGEGQGEDSPDQGASRGRGLGRPQRHGALSPQQAC